MQDETPTEARSKALVDGLKECQQLLRIAGSDSMAKALLHQP